MSNQQTDGHRQIKTGAVLLYIRGSEIYRHLLRGILYAGVLYRGADTLLGLTDSGIRHTYDICPRHTGRDIHLYIDDEAVDTLRSRAVCPCKHGASPP